MSERKELVGNYKAREAKFGTIECLGFSVDDLKEMLATAEENGGWCNLELLTSQAGNKYMKINRWKPDGNKSKGGGKPAADAPTKEDRATQIQQAQNDEDLPF